MNFLSKPGAIDFGVREAGPDDSYEMWLWWNDPVTRRMMRLNEYVPWENHRAWFNITLQNPEKILVMIVCRFGKIGVVRHDHKGQGVFETSIHFNPMFRGQGLGGHALSSARIHLSARKTLRAQFATLKKVNIASHKSFERGGYVFGPPPAHVPGLDEFNPTEELFCLWTSETLKSTSAFSP